ncbi:MAG: translation elongation factor 4 [Clostridiales bacterium]|nr:translation elongation factor 4 [Clostridiales bacterium]
MNQENIRNFCIIAHIDHGKSTLADRILEYTGTLSAREMTTKQVLDQMDLEKERGITIKLTAVRMQYEAPDGEIYLLNLIDTPGHVDFSYEVSRSLAACEGALLVVDATQGIEAQTLANVYLALEHDLEIIPVINKIDLPSADPEGVIKEIEEVIGLDCSQAILTSAKDGTGIPEVVQGVIDRIPCPKGDAQAPLKALIFDSSFDAYRGALSYIRIFDGSVAKGDMIQMMSSGKKYEVIETGAFMPGPKLVDSLEAGMVGYVAASIKNVKDTRVGDTITGGDKPAETPLPGYRSATPMVYCGIYPVEANDYDKLRDALDKLQLNDAALLYEPETSVALGFGYRCGFLGLLHLDIVHERLEREYDLSLITTAPSVVYEILQTDRKVILIDNPAKIPPVQKIEEIREPFVAASIMAPSDYIGAVMELCRDRRGSFINMDYMTPSRVHLHYDLPLAEIIYDFFDELKSRTKGYASLDYELKEYRASELIKLDILVNGEAVDALSVIVHRDKAQARGRKLVVRLRSLIPRQMFEVPVQAAIGTKVIARESVKAFRKNVIDKCYGGDVTRKRKLLEKQKEGKKRMKMVGSVEIPQEAFMAVLSLDDED